MTDEPMMFAWPSDALARRLAAYGVALTPTAESAARTRARVMAHAAVTLGAPSRRADAAVLVVDRRRTVRRRVAFALVAAGIGVGAISGAVAAADAGGPLYDARLWAEALTLPAAADARLDADLTRLDRRLSEARSAARSGNENGARAALDAYVDVMDDAVAAAGTDSTRDARIASAVGAHRAVLAALAGRLPGPASDAVDRALARSDAALTKLGASTPGSGDGSAGETGGGKGSGGAGVGAGRPSPTASVKSSASPSPKAQPTPRPSRQASPPPRPTSAPPTRAPSPTPSATDEQGNDNQGQTRGSGGQIRTSTSRPRPTPSR
jgi:hypothetical protein